MGLRHMPDWKPALLCPKFSIKPLNHSVRFFLTHSSSDPTSFSHSSLSQEAGSEAIAIQWVLPGFVIHNLRCRNPAQPETAEKTGGTGLSSKTKLLTEGRASAYWGNISTTRLQAQPCRRWKSTNVWLCSCPWWEYCWAHFSSAQAGGWIML